MSDLEMHSEMLEVTAFQRSVGSEVSSFTHVNRKYMVYFEDPSDVVCLNATSLTMTDVECDDDSDEEGLWELISMSSCSFSHRSDRSRSELSIGEEIEEVSIEGPDNSDKVTDGLPGPIIAGCRRISNSTHVYLFGLTSSLT